MNRKIYFNDKFIEFVDNGMQTSQNQAFKFFESLENEKALNAVVDEFLDSAKTAPLTVSNMSFSAAMKILKKRFHYIEAAGGFIEKDGKFLFIRRHNRWDLPKGKLEKKETVEAAAIRECEEECGISRLQIIKPLNSTFHLYEHKKGYALKQSYWFYMRTDYDKALTPQLEEDITEVRWFSPGEIEAVALQDTYYTIADVIKDGLKA